MTMAKLNKPKMDVYLVPEEQCIFNNRFEKRENPCPCTFNVTWLGLDKFQNIMYGVCRGRKEIVMHSVFGGPVKVIKKVEFRDFHKCKSAWETWAISSCGKFIAIVQYPRFRQNAYSFEGSKEDFMTERRKFYLFSTETGETKPFDLQKILNSEETFKKLSFYHSQQFGWICIDDSSDYSFEPQFRMYRMVFDELEKTCGFEYMAEWSENSSFDSWPLIRERNAMFFSQGYSEVKIFDFETSLWSLKQINNTLPARQRYFICSDVGQQRVIAITNEVNTHSDLHMYHLVGTNLDLWERLPLAFKCKCLRRKNYVSEYPRLSFACCATDLIFTKVLPKHVFCAFIDVLPLKSLAIKQLFSMYDKSDRFINFTDWPCQLRRKYIGPDWTW